MIIITSNSSLRISSLSLSLIAAHRFRRNIFALRRKQLSIPGRSCRRVTLIGVCGSTLSIGRTKLRIGVVASQIYERSLVVVVADMKSRTQIITASKSAKTWNRTCMRFAHRASPPIKSRGMVLKNWMYIKPKFTAKSDPAQRKIGHEGECRILPQEAIAGLSKSASESGRSCSA